MRALSRHGVAVPIAASLAHMPGSESSVKTGQSRILLPESRLRLMPLSDGGCRSSVDSGVPVSASGGRDGCGASYGLRDRRLLAGTPESRVAPLNARGAGFVSGLASQPARRDATDYDRQPRARSFAAARAATGAVPLSAVPVYPIQLWRRAYQEHDVTLPERHTPVTKIFSKEIPAMARHRNTRMTAEQVEEAVVFVLRAMSDGRLDPAEAEGARIRLLTARDSAWHTDHCEALADAIRHNVQTPAYLQTLAAKARYELPDEAA
jgi:hypothetical protein